MAPRKRQKPQLSKAEQNRLARAFETAERETHRSVSRSNGLRAITPTHSMGVMSRAE